MSPFSFQINEPQSVNVDLTALRHAPWFFFAHRPVLPVEDAAVRCPACPALWNIYPVKCEAYFSGAKSIPPG